MACGPSRVSAVSTLSISTESSVDPHPGLREHALRAWNDPDLRWRLRPLATQGLIALADDPAIRVRFLATLLLGDRCGREPAALATLGQIAARDASDPWMRLAILSGLAESSLAFIPMCLAITPSEGRTQLLTQAAAILGVRRRTPELASLLGMIADRAERPDHSLEAHDPALGNGRRSGAVRPATPCPHRHGAAGVEIPHGSPHSAVAGRVETGCLRSADGGTPRGARRAGAGPARPCRGRHPRIAGGDSTAWSPVGRCTGRLPSGKDISRRHGAGPLGRTGAGDASRSSGVRSPARRCWPNPSSAPSSGR